MDLHDERAPSPGGPHPSPPIPAAAPQAPRWACGTACTSCAVRRFCLPAWEEPGAESRLADLFIGRRRVRKGQALFRQGEKFASLYAVRYGTFKSGASLRDGHEQVMAFHLPGELFGFDGLANGIHPTTATALEDAEVCVIPYPELNEAAGVSRRVRNQLTSTISQQLVEERNLLSLVANTSSEQRVAAFIWNLAQRMSDRGYSAREFHLRMTRDEIGSYLGITLETVSRCLASLARQRLLEVRRRRIVILDPQAMRDLYLHQ